jgi:hypothetical protein|tara:strand:+ start:401 stop:790 length:390 start_codon:yes stop_codon:yes gene_type:complete
MKVSEFKKVIKPLIKECIKEVILEEGILSSVVSEVAKGLQGGLVTETPTHKDTGEETRLQEEVMEEQRQERIKRLNESTKMGSVNVFEGTHQIAESNQGSPLQGVAPSDSGVDITGILGLAKGKWKHLV